MLLCFHLGYRHVQLRSANNQPLELSTLFIFSQLEDDMTSSSTCRSLVTDASVMSTSGQSAVDRSRPVRGVLVRAKDSIDGTSCGLLLENEVGNISANWQLFIFIRWADIPFILSFFIGILFSVFCVLSDNLFGIINHLTYYKFCNFQPNFYLLFCSHQSLAFVILLVFSQKLILFHIALWLIESVFLATCMYIFFSSGSFSSLSFPTQDFSLLLFFSIFSFYTHVDFLGSNPRAPMSYIY